jgi:hypothetical protein
LVLLQMVVSDRGLRGGMLIEALDRVLKFASCHGCEWPGCHKGSELQRVLDDVVDLLLDDVEESHVISGRCRSGRVVAQVVVAPL